MGCSSAYVALLTWRGCCAPQCYMLLPRPDSTGHITTGHKSFMRKAHSLCCWLYPLKRSTHGASMGVLLAGSLAGLARTFAARLHACCAAACHMLPLAVQHMLWCGCLLRHPAQHVARRCWCRPFGAALGKLAMVHQHDVSWPAGAQVTTCDVPVWRSLYSCHLLPHQPPPAVWYTPDLLISL